MIRSSVSNTKNNLSALLQQVKAGETILITERDRPIAQVVPFDDLPYDDHLKDLIRRGVVRPPLRPRSPLPIVPIELEGGGYAGTVEALLEERESGW